MSEYFLIREPFPNSGSIGIRDATDDMAMLFSLRTSQGNVLCRYAAYT
jgi:hypothetical protein